MISQSQLQRNMIEENNITTMCLTYVDLIDNIWYYKLKTLRLVKKNRIYTRELNREFHTGLSSLYTKG